jgi:hypothetical protein
MNNVLASIHNKSILCSFSHDVILHQIGKLVTWFSESRVKQTYAFAKEFEDDCIKFVVCSYIMAVLDDLEADESKPLSREEYYAVVKKSKMQWLQKRERRQRDEMYLGKPSFPNELHCFLDEFYKTAINLLGFNAIKLQDAELK